MTEVMTSVVAMFCQEPSLLQISTPTPIRNKFSPKTLSRHIDMPCNVLMEPLQYSEKCCL